LSTVGIIANPSSGKDIRRLVSHSRLISNQEKINIVRRILSGLEASGTNKVVLMPDSSNLALTATSEYGGSLEVETLSMPVLNRDLDTTRAAEIMSNIGLDAIVVLGGDGTSRAASKQLGNVPIMPVSTGTNNVFPYLIEGTLAGLATGFVASGIPDIDDCAPRHSYLHIETDSGQQDMALVDVAISKERYVGARAIWDVSSVTELFLCIAEPSSIGLSAVGGMLHPISRTDPKGLHISLSSAVGKNSVTAPVVPGGLDPVFFSNYSVMSPGEEFKIYRSPCTIALDGERTIPLQPSQQAMVKINLNGPRVINPYESLRLAAEKGFFTTR